MSPSVEEERRVAWDGKAYTRAEFWRWYGESQFDRHWTEASPLAHADHSFPSTQPPLLSSMSSQNFHVMAENISKHFNCEAPTEVNGYIRLPYGCVVHLKRSGTVGAYVGWSLVESSDGVKGWLPSCCLKLQQSDAGVQWEPPATNADDADAGGSKQTCMHCKQRTVWICAGVSDSSICLKAQGFTRSKSGSRAWRCHECSPFVQSVTERHLDACCQQSHGIFFPPLVQLPVHVVTALPALDKLVCEFWDGGAKIQWLLPESPPDFWAKKIRNPLIWHGDERHVKQTARIDFYRGEQEDDLQNVEWEAWLQNMPCVMTGPLNLSRM